MIPFHSTIMVGIRACIFIGEAFAFDALQILAYAAVMFSMIHLFIVLIEEPGLKRRFGASYETYCQSVPRWLPRVSALRQSKRELHRRGL